MYADRSGFVVLCQPKTGSTAARQMLFRHGNGTPNFARVHVPADKWRAYLGSMEGWLHELATDPDTRVYGLLREPAAWYRSVYRYALSDRCGPKQRRILDTWESLRHGTGFGSVLRSWTSQGGIQHDAFRDEMLNPAPHTEARTLYQASVQHYYAPSVRFLRTEHLAEDIGALLGVKVVDQRHNVTRGPDVAMPPGCAEMIEQDAAFYAALVEEA